MSNSDAARLVTDFKRATICLKLLTNQVSPQLRVLTPEAELASLWRVPFGDNRWYSAIIAESGTELKTKSRREMVNDWWQMFVALGDRYLL